MFEVLRHLQRLRLSVLSINIRTPMPKNENLQKQLDEKREMGKHPYELQWSGQRLPPLEQRRHGMIGEGIRQQREESLGNSQGLGKGMLWHGNPSLLVMLACVGLWVAVRPWSQATSYLALVGARIQGINLSLTPLPETNQIPWERWGVTQRMLLSSALNIFLLCQHEIKHPPFLSPMSSTCKLEENHVACLFVCHVNN